MKEQLKAVERDLANPLGKETVFFPNGPKTLLK